MTFKTILAIIGLFIFSWNSIGQNEASINDLQPLNNTEWEGRLMYLNYSDNREVFLDTRLSIELNDKYIIMKTSYPNEPQANNTSRVRFKKNGTYFGSEKITYVQRHEDGSFQMTTTFSVKDNNREATQIKTYKFDSQHLSVTTEIDYKDGSPKFIRNKTTYQLLQE